MRYLVTGGAGFIGSHVVEALVAAGREVRVLDNFQSGSVANLAAVLGVIDLREGDIRDPETVRRAVVGIDYVIHQAALPSVHGSIADPLTNHAVNATGTLNVLVAAREAGVRRVVYASSCSVYGEDPALPKTETMRPAPCSPYAVAKLAGEQYCQAFTHTYGLETIALRYFNVFGPRQNPHAQYAAVVPKFITRMLQGQPPTVYGDGLQSRDFIYVEDVARANLLACVTSTGVGEVFNVGVGVCYTLLDLIASLNRLFATQLEPVFAPAVPGDIRASLASIERARSFLGYTADIGFEEGLRRTAQAFSALATPVG